MGISLNPSTLLNGQGLDVSSLVTQILNQKSGQLSEWSSEQTLLHTQAGLLTNINNDLSSLSSAVIALSDPLGIFAAQSAVSSNQSVVTATADASAVAANHSIVVNSLATAGLLYTATVAGGADVSILPQDASQATLKFQIGGTQGVTAEIAITSGSNGTLNTLASSINQKSAANNWGIQASVITDADGSRLSITSQATGTPGALSVNNDSTALVFNPALGGTNASLVIDGVPYSSTTNTISKAITGVTLQLSTSAPNMPVQVSVGRDTTRIVDAINTFVTAYNRLISDINVQYLVDPTTNTEGPLGSDSSLRTLQSILLKDVTTSISGNSGLVNLASLGINMNNDGTLTVGTTPSGQSLNQVLQSNPQVFQAFFQNDASTGFANLFHQDLINLTNPTEGLINVDLAQNKAQQQNLADSITKFQDQLREQQKQLTKQFSQVNASLQVYPLLLQQVTQTLDSLTMNSSSGQK